MSLSFFDLFMDICHKLLYLFWRHLWWLLIINQSCILNHVKSGPFGRSNTVLFIKQIPLLFRLEINPLTQTSVDILNKKYICLEESMKFRLMEWNIKTIYTTQQTLMCSATIHTEIVSASFRMKTFPGVVKYRLLQESHIFVFILLFYFKSMHVII